MKTNPQYKKSGAMFMVAAFGVVILAISAVTTFSFFSTYFSSIFPTGMLGPELASLLAGGAGVILFDIASVYWLHTFLNHAETSEQRGIALIMLIVTFVGAAGASIAQLGLAASGDVALDPATRQSIANASVWTVIIGVVSNFGANIAYGRFSLASKQAVMEADRRDMVQNAEDEQARLLDGLIAQNVKELITAEAGILAQEQANRVVAAFRAREMAKYAGVEGKSETAVPPTPPPPAPVQLPTIGSSDNDLPVAGSSMNVMPEPDKSRYYVSDPSHKSKLSHPLEANNPENLIPVVLNKVERGECTDFVRIVDRMTGEYVWWYMQESNKGNLPQDHLEAINAGNPTGKPQPVNGHGPK